MAVDPFVMTHTFLAPRDRVWALYSEPAHVEASLRGEGVEVLRSAMRFEVGGTHHYGTRGPGPAELWGLQRYLAIVPRERIELVQAFSTAEGGVAPHPMAPTWPREMTAVTVFEDTADGHTRVTVSWEPREADDAAVATFDAARAGMTQGFASLFAKLDAYLATLPA